MKLIRYYRDNSYDIRDVDNVSDEARYFKTDTLHISYNEYLDKLDSVKCLPEYETDENLRDGFIFIYTERKGIKVIPKSAIITAIELDDGKYKVRTRDKNIIMTLDELQSQYIILQGGLENA